MPSPRPKPTALKLISGNAGKRKINKAEPKPKREIPSCPAHMSDAGKVAWGRLSVLLDRMGVLTEADSAALNVQLFQLQAGKDHGWADGGIVRKQHHSITLPVEVLEGGLAANAHCGDLALLHLRLAANAYDVAVADGGGHAVTVAGQGKSARHAAGTPI